MPVCNTCTLKNLKDNFFSLQLKWVSLIAMFDLWQGLNWPKPGGFRDEHFKLQLMHDI